ncbi:MAG TPA: 4Fe-4S binding protein [Aggregatilinea sp.]|uniref:4Fe-4S dicluster domain-containing protein n=1 Tax=Aggregatilinea sp. TaxID=2806333 RepID=UPI002CEB1C03|nr:4Fe-4S dicluster domain-containing protein [Aggregatilinea sp.]HML23993.1 4Fe-4S binding protein [Aggregatilinea sp.]
MSAGLPVQLAPMAATPRQIHPERCLRQRHQHAACAYCQDVCPTGAIRFSQRAVFLTADDCIGCGLCLSTCPVECFETSAWSERSLVSALDRVNTPTVEIVCKSHPAPQMGDETVPVIQIGACLGAVSPGVWYEVGLGAAARVRLEHCSGCALAEAARYTHKAVELANTWLQSSGHAPTLLIAEESDPAPASATRRAVVSAEQKIVNRRSFLTFAFARSSGAPQQALTGLPEDEEVQQKLPPHTPVWLRHLSAIYPTSAAGAEARSEPEATETRWPTLSVESNCVACGACARYCPSGALSTTSVEGQYQHLFTPGFCLGCGLCAQVCSTGALTRSYAPDDAPFETRVMQERSVGVCKKCGNPALDMLNGLCYWCATEPPMRSVLNSAKGYLFQRSILKTNLNDAFNDAD